MQNEELAKRLTKELASQGKLVEAGWVGYHLGVMHPNSPAIQIQECRRAFMMGAAHIFFSLMTAMDEGTEPTEGDLKKMELIQKELEVFNEEMKARAREIRQAKN